MQASIISESSYTIIRSNIMSSLKENIHIETLVSALISGDFRTVLPILLLQQKSSSELTFPNKFTPLHYACRHGRLDVVQSLITNCIGYTIESRDVNGCTPLHTAAKYGHFNIVKYLISRLLMSLISIKISTKLSSALMSLFQGKLADQHTNLNGNTPLHAACMGGHLDIVKFLINTIGCDPLSINIEGLPCLHMAAEHGHLNVVEYFIRGGRE